MDTDDTNEDVKMTDNQCNINKEEQVPARSQKVNSFSIDSLLSDNKTNYSQLEEDRCSIQCSSFVVDDGETFSNLSARMRYEPSVQIAPEFERNSIEEQSSILRTSQSCPSASYSRSFSEGKQYK